MDKVHLRSLRLRQSIYINLLYIVYSVASVLLLLQPVYIICIVLVCFFGVSAAFTSRSSKLWGLLPGMEELIKYENAKLGDSLHTHYLSRVFLSVAAATLALVQLFFKYNSHHTLISVMPKWYLYLVPIVIVSLGNIMFSIRSKRIDNTHQEQLRIVTRDLALFVTIFSIVVVSMTILGMIVIFIMCR